MVNAKVLWSDDHTHFWPYPQRQHFDQLLIYMNMQKNHVISLICYGDMVDYKIPTIWFGENILVHISWAKLFPNMGFV